MAENNRNRGNQGRNQQSQSIGNQQGTTQTGGQNSGGTNRTADRDLGSAAPRSSSNKKDRGRSGK